MRKILIPGHVENIKVIDGVEIGGVVLNPFEYTDMISELRECEQDAKAAIVVIRHSLRTIKINGKNVELQTIVDKKTKGAKLLDSSIALIPGNCCASISQKLMGINTLTEDEKKN